MARIVSSCTLVVDLAGGLDQVLKMGAGEKVTEVNEFAVPLVFDVDGSPSILSCWDGLTGTISALTYCSLNLS